MNIDLESRDVDTNKGKSAASYWGGDFRLFLNKLEPDVNIFNDKMHRIHASYWKNVKFKALIVDKNTYEFNFLLLQHSWNGKLKYMKAIDF